MTEGLMLDRSQRTLLVRDLAAMSDREVEGEDADDSVDESPRDETGAREHGVGGGLDESFAPRARSAQRGR